MGASSHLNVARIPHENARQNPTHSHEHRTPNTNPSSRPSPLIKGRRRTLVWFWNMRTAWIRCPQQASIAEEEGGIPPGCAYITKLIPVVVPFCPLTTTGYFLPTLRVAFELRRRATRPSVMGSARVVCRSLRPAGPQRRGPRSPGAFLTGSGFMPRTHG